MVNGANETITRNAKTLYHDDSISVILVERLSKNTLSSFT